MFKSKSTLEKQYYDLTTEFNRYKQTHPDKITRGLTIYDNSSTSDGWLIIVTQDEYRSLKNSNDELKAENNSLYNQLEQLKRDYVELLDKYKVHLEDIIDRYEKM